MTELALKDIFKLSAKVLEKQDTSFKHPSGNRVTTKDLADRLRLLCGWLYPGAVTGDITKVVRCCHCRYYKTYKRKKDAKAVPFKACSLDMKKRDPMFFCKDGEEV